MVKPESRARHWATRYANQVSLGYKPKVVFTMEEWMAMGAHKDDRRCSDDRGLSNPDLRAIRFNVSAHLCLHDLRDTAAHEITHLRWPSLRHNELFARRVEAVRLGTRVGPPKSRLPDALR